VSTTRHGISATMSTDGAWYWRRTSSTPFYSDDMQNIVIGAGLGQWHALSFATPASVLNTATGRYELQVSSSAMPGRVGVSISNPGGNYQVVAHAYALDGSWGSAQDTSDATRLVPTLQELTGIFYFGDAGFPPGGTTEFALFIGDQFSSGTGTIYFTDFAVYQVERARVLDLQPERATVTLDESWSPYVQATLVCPLPSGDPLSIIDPRDNLRVNLNLTASGAGSLTAADLTAMYAGQTAANLTTAFSGQTASYLTTLWGQSYNTPLDLSLNVSRSMNLGLRSRSLDYIAGTMTLTLGSDEFLLQDYIRLDLTNPSWQPPAVTSLKSLVQWALTLIGGALDPSSSDAVINSADVVWNQGEDLWSFLDGFMSNAGLRLWCDENRVWWLAPAFDGSAGEAFITNLTGLDDDLDRTTWGNGVVLVYTYTDPTTGATTTRYQGSYGAEYTKGVVVKKVSKAAPTGAAATLERAMSRGRAVVAKAVNNYAVTPGLTGYLSTTSTTIPPVLISAVAFDFPSDEMTVRTRDLP
jgi:hypothetical protein